MREPDEQQEREQERRLHTTLGLLQLGGLGLLAMMAAGLLPRLLAGWFPALGKPWVTAAAAVVAALGAVALSVLRLRKIWRDADERASGGGRAPPR